MTSIADLWEDHRARLRGFVAKRVRDRHAEEDILQEVFLKLQANRHTLKSPESISAWLFRVAANAIADYYRAHRPTEELSDDIASQEHAEHERDYAAELAPCLRPMIARLPAKYRRALVLSEMRGLTQREVADRLGISLSGAKSRVQRGRQHLRQGLARCCDIEVGPNGILGYEVRDKACGCDVE